MNSFKRKLTDENVENGTQDRKKIRRKIETTQKNDAACSSAVNSEYNELLIKQEVKEKPMDEGDVAESVSPSISTVDQTMKCEPKESVKNITKKKTKSSFRDFYNNGNKCYSDYSINKSQEILFLYFIEERPIFLNLSRILTLPPYRICWDDICNRMNSIGPPRYTPNVWRKIWLHQLKTFHPDHRIKAGEIALKDPEYILQFSMLRMSRCNRRRAVKAKKSTNSTPNEDQTIKNGSNNGQKNSAVCINLTDYIEDTKKLIWQELQSAKKQKIKRDLQSNPVLGIQSNVIEKNSPGLQAAEKQNKQSLENNYYSLNVVSSEVAEVGIALRGAEVTDATHIDSAQQNNITTEHNYGELLLGYQSNNVSNELIFAGSSEFQSGSKAKSESELITLSKHAETIQIKLGTDVTEVSTSEKNKTNLNKDENGMNISERRISVANKQAFQMRVPVLDKRMNESIPENVLNSQQHNKTTHLYVNESSRNVSSAIERTLSNNENESSKTTTKRNSIESSTVPKLVNVSDATQHYENIPTSHSMEGAVITTSNRNEESQNPAYPLDRQIMNAMQKVYQIPKTLITKIGSGINQRETNSSPDFELGNHIESTLTRCVPILRRSTSQSESNQLIMVTEPIICNSLDTPDNSVFQHRKDNTISNTNVSGRVHALQIAKKVASKRQSPSSETPSSPSTSTESQDRNSKNGEINLEGDHQVKPKRNLYRSVASETDVMVPILESVSNIKSNQCESLVKILHERNELEKKKIKLMRRSEKRLAQYREKKLALYKREIEALELQAKNSSEKSIKAVYF